MYLCSSCCCWSSSTSVSWMADWIITVIDVGMVRRTVTHPFFLSWVLHILAGGSLDLEWNCKLSRLFIQSVFWEVRVSIILSKKGKDVYVHVFYSEWFPRYSCFTVQMSNTPCSHTSYKLRWCWRLNFRQYIYYAM
jgi:hypothetical protein